MADGSLSIFVWAELSRRPGMQPEGWRNGLQPADKESSTTKWTGGFAPKTVAGWWLKQHTSGRCMSEMHQSNTDTMWCGYIWRDFWGQIEAADGDCRWSNPESRSVCNLRPWCSGRLRGGWYSSANRRPTVGRGLVPLSRAPAAVVAWRLWSHAECLSSRIAFKSLSVWPSNKALDALADWAVI